jgi:hypothetical protein
LDFHLALVVVGVHPGAGVGRQEGDEELLADGAGKHLLDVIALKTSSNIF